MKYHAWYMKWPEGAFALVENCRLEVESPWYIRGMSAWARKQTGFTIVELLIVIVVIAILAAITLVTYTGVQTRAKDSQMASAMNAYVKGVALYYSTYSNALPSSVPACFNGTACWSGTDAAGGAALRTELRKVMSSLPDVPSPYAALLVPSATTTDTPNGSNYTGTYILFQQSSGQACQAISGTRFLNTSVSGDVRVCRAALELN